MKRVSVSIILTSFLLRSTSAQIMKLSDILDSIQQSYPSLKMYDANIQSLDVAAKGARNWMAPEISTGLWMVPYNTSLWKSDGMGTPGMGQYMISVEQMFPNKKYNESNEAYMEAMSSVEKENKQATLNEVFALAKKSYYEWIILQKKISLLSQNEKLLQFMITNAETRYKNGLGKISAYYKAKASQGDIGNMRIDLENGITQKRIALNTLMNRDKLQEFSIDTNYVLNDHSSSIFDSSFFDSNRSDIKAIDKNIQLTYLQQNIERANLKPQFGVTYSHMFGFGGLAAQYTLMGMMRVPINWSTRMNKANIESLKWKIVSLENQKLSMSNEYSGMANQLQQNIRAKKKQVELFEQNIIPALRKNYESTLLAYEQNTEELFELYDSWQTLNNTQMEYFNQVEELLDMEVDLEKIMEVK